MFTNCHIYSYTDNLLNIYRQSKTAVMFQYSKKAHNVFVKTRTNNTHYVHIHPKQSHECKFHNRTFSHKPLWYVTAQESIGVNNTTNVGLKTFNCFNFMALVLCTLAHCHDLLGYYYYYQTNIDSKVNRFFFKCIPASRIVRTQLHLDCLFNKITSDSWRC